MKRIRKGAQPAELIAWKRGKRWRSAPPEWDELPSEPSAAIRRTTQSDQLLLCCYCCASIADGAFHIEHYQPQSLYPAARFEWSNLLASCESFQKATFEGRPVETQLHCGHKKDNELIYVKPTINGIESKFRFTLLGEVKPSKALSGKLYKEVDDTIEILNLNAPSLLRRRASILSQASADVEKLTKDAWQHKYLSVVNGSCLEFWPALKYNFDNIWKARF